jgi:hypothetical protein
MDELIATFRERGDLAHLALFLWATSASGLAAFALRELAAASGRFDDFVREFARFNDIFRGPDAAQRGRKRKRAASPEPGLSIGGH